MTQNYSELYDYLSAQFEEVGGYEFYREIFPDNENSGERHMDFSHPNAIYLYRDEEDAGKKTLRRRVMLNDTWEDDYVEFVERNPMTLCSGLTYRRRANKLEHAQRMNALIFDLDGVGAKEIANLFLRFGQPASRIRTLPMPTFLVLSGNGLHVYYVFEEPIDLYPNIKIQLKALKYALTFRMWDYKATSQNKAIQYQSINQGFRMVGSTNAKYDVPLVAFRTGDPVTLDYLNDYVKPENRVDLNRPFSPSKMTRTAAKEKYPEWYQRVVIEGSKRKKKWDIAGKVHGSDPYALYHWWLRQIDEAKGGHRYFYMMCLAIYAVKCDVPKAKLKEDLHDAFEELRKIEHENPLTEDDIRSALEAYDREYYNFTIEDIEKLSDIRIDRNKRNGRPQKTHLRLARASRDILCEERGKSDWREGNGRPSAEATVRVWRKKNPEGTKAECIRDTGLSKPTVYKWWEQP